MVDVVAIERGYFGGARREPGERFALPDALWKDEKRRPKWVRLARSGKAVEAEPAPDWLLPDAQQSQNSSQPVD